MSRKISVPYKWSVENGMLLLGFDASGTFEIVARRRSTTMGKVTSTSRIFDGDNESEESYKSLLIKMIAIRLSSRELIRSTPERRKMISENIAILTAELAEEIETARRQKNLRENAYNQAIPSIITGSTGNGYRSA